MAVAALFVSACSAEPPERGGEDPAPNAAITDFANRMAGVQKPPPPAKPFDRSEKTDLLEFAYAWPAQAASVPFIEEKLRKAMETGKADALKMAKDDRKSAEQSGFPFRPHSLEVRWSVTADTPRFLSLQSTTYTYTGGAHGMTGYDMLLWDKRRNRETNIRALMTSPEAFAAAIRDRFCEALDKERARKRGGPVVPGDDPFTQCIDPMKEVLVPVSKDGKLIDSFTVIVGPYSAGPYAEGAYEVPIPVDAAIRNAIKTEYQGAFVNA